MKRWELVRVVEKRREEDLVTAAEASPESETSVG